MSESTDTAYEYDTRMSTPSAGAPPDRPLPRGLKLLAVIVVVLVLLGIAFRLLGRTFAEHNVAEATRAAATPAVNVIHPSVIGTTSEIALPGNTQAFQDTPIYSRTSGYLKQWYVDIGQHVSAGQLMATIQTPEIDEQLQVAQADLKSTQADLNLANTTSERYQNLLKSDSVSKQETDVAVSGAAAKRASVDAAQANVRRLQQLQSFERIYAPYAGVVTVRNANVGDLINAGSSTSGTANQIFRVASIQELRVFVAVPEVYAPLIRDGSTATLTLDEYPGRIFTGRVTRNSNAIDPISRTLNVEVDVDNTDGRLLPGAYIFVHFKIPQQTQLLSVPANALIFRAEGLQVGLVRNGHIHLQPVTIGKDNGKTLEIATGLTSSDEVILDPSDSIAEGQPVTVSSRAEQH